MDKRPQTAKPVSAATRAMLDAMTEDGAKPASGDKLKIARQKLVEFRDLKKQVEDMQAVVKEKTARINELQQKELVEVFNAARIDRLGLPAEGNMPAFEVELDDYFHANIPAENKDSAYAFLKKKGWEDIIKTTFTISFGLAEAKLVREFRAKLDKLRLGKGKAAVPIDYEVEQGVPWNTLTAFIKSEFKANRPLNQKELGLLGATVGRIAKIKQQKKERK